MFAIFYSRCQFSKISLNMQTYCSQVNDLYVAMHCFYFMLFSCVCLMFFCFYMLSTPSLGSLGVCLMKYSTVVPRYGISSL